MRSSAILSMGAPAALFVAIVVVIFSRGVYLPSWISVQAVNLPPDNYTLYLDSGHGYSESDALVERVTARQEESVLRFRLPHRQIERVRFDPGTRAQDFFIDQICVSSLLRERCWTSGQLVDSVAPLAGIESIALDNARLRIVAIDNDPYLDLGPNIPNVRERYARINTWLALATAFLICAALYVWFPAMRGLIQRLPDIELVRPYPLVLATCIAVSVFLYLGADRNFSNSARFDGDTWEYQSLAVNWSKGHGLRFGAIEPFAVYRFDDDASSKSHYAGFVKRGQRGGSYNHLRTPGYPVFLGIIYHSFGVSPAIAKKVQLLLIVVSCAVLPLVGFFFWNWAGMWGGVICAPVVFMQYQRTAATLMTEPLIIFSLTGMLLAFMVWRRFTNAYTSAAFGIALGLCLLVKGSMMFLPLLFIPYCIWSMRKRKIARWIRYGLVLAGFFILAIGTWSSVVSYQTGRLVLLSTQGTSVLLDGNNEYSIQDGAGWRPDWRSDKYSFYNRKDVKPLATPVKVILFLKEHIRQVPSLIDDKIRLGFTSTYLFLIVLFFFLESYLAFRKKLIRRRRHNIDLIAGIILLAVLAYFGPLGIGHYYLYLAFGVLLSRALMIKDDAYFVPVPMLLIFLNFLFLTILIFGDKRFTMPIDGLVTLTAYSYALKIFCDCAGQAEPGLVRR